MIFNVKTVTCHNSLPATFEKAHYSTCRYSSRLKELMRINNKWIFLYFWFLKHKLRPYKNFRFETVDKLILNRGNELYLSAPSHTTIESPEWYTFPLVYNILQVFCSSPQGHLTNRFCCLSSVLKNNVFVLTTEKTIL